MKISKALALTLAIALVEAGAMLLSFVTFDSIHKGNHIDHAWGLGIIVGRLIAYSAVFLFCWGTTFQLKPIRGKPFNLLTLLSLMLILVGSEFLNRPFLDAEKWFNPDLPEYSFQGFTKIQIYFSISSLFLAPVLEELFFRKLVLGNLVKRYSISTALLTSSLLFSLIHWETPFNLIPAFLFGIISGILYLKSGRLRYSILLHFMYNGLNLLVATNAELYYDWLSWLGTGYEYWGLFALGMIITLFALKMVPFQQEDKSLKLKLAKFTRKST